MRRPEIPFTPMKGPTMALDDVPESVAPDYAPHDLTQDLEAYEKMVEREAAKHRFIGAALRLGQDAGPIMAALLEENRFAAPEVSDSYFRDLRQEAEDWADWSDPSVLQAYACAALTRLERADYLGQVTRKRLFAAIWRSFTPEDRAAFLAKVDPKERKKI
jgi:hypothetical protein